MIQNYKYSYFSVQHLISSLLQNKHIGHYYISPFMDLDIHKLPNIHGRLYTIPFTYTSQDINYDLLYFSLKRNKVEYLTVIHVEWENNITGNRLNTDSMRIISNQFADSILWVVDITAAADLNLESDIFKDLNVIFYKKNKNWCAAHTNSKFFTLTNWIFETEYNGLVSVITTDESLILGRTIRRILIGNSQVTYIGNEDQFKNWSIIYFSSKKPILDSKLKCIKTEYDQDYKTIKWYYKFEAKNYSPLDIRFLQIQLKDLNND